MVRPDFKKWNQTAEGHWFSWVGFAQFKRKYPKITSYGAIFGPKLSEFSATHLPKTAFPFN